MTHTYANFLLQYYCLDNLFTGSINNIIELENHTNFEFVNHDIIEPHYRDDIDEIYNLACPASPLDYQNNLLKQLKHAL